MREAVLHMRNRILRRTLQVLLPAVIVVSAALVCGCRKAGPQICVEDNKGVVILIVHSTTDAEQGKTTPVDVHTDAKGNLGID
jgi:hypothetical protein